MTGAVRRHGTRWGRRPAPVGGPTARGTARNTGRVQVHVGSLSIDLLLGDVHSLKEKRSVVRPVVAELRRRFPVSVAETGHLDLHRRAEVGVGVVGSDARHCRDVLEACEALVAGRPEVEVLATRVRVWDDEDE